MNSNGLGKSHLALKDDNVSSAKRSKSIWKLSEKWDKNKDWYFGYVCYEEKDKIEDLHSENSGLVKFPSRSFFRPNCLMKWDKAGKREVIRNDLDLSLISSSKDFHSSSIELIQKTPKEEYLEHFKKIMFHIKRGDIYELNYCIHWMAMNASIDPFLTYEKLNERTQAPYSCFLKRKNKYLLCASPERFIQKKGSHIKSQPIKGTAKRSSNRELDRKMMQDLTINQKEIAENVMTTDVVRNDLSRIAQKNSVSVEELAHIHSFETVHHLISTITAEVKNGTSFTDIIRATFPMASMTGAPKISAMKIIEEHEDLQRGLYSGSVGYIDPNGDFDLNVVIRSILYDDKKKVIDIPVGGAITIKSDPEKEYEECLVKAEAMFEALK